MFQLLFQRSMDSGTVPQLWKHSTVVPIPKKSSVKAQNDLRPVALTTLMMKAMERVIKRHIITLTNPLMDPFQFEYHAGRGLNDVKTLMDKAHKHYSQTTVCRLLFCIQHLTATYPCRDTLHPLQPGPPADPVGYRLHDQQITEGAGQ